MTRGIVGKKGAGKSLLALFQMLEHLADGGAVASNIALDGDAVARWCWKRGHDYRHDDQFTLLDLNKEPRFYRDCPRSPVRNASGRDIVRIYIDEAHLFFPASRYRELASEFEELHDWNSQCRKAGQHLYMITQAWENIWGALRRQTEQRFECRDMRSIKLPMVGTGLGWAFGLTWALKDEETNERLEGGTSRITPGVVECYDTAQVYSDTMAELFELMPEYRAERRKVPRWRRGRLPAHLRKPKKG